MVALALWPCSCVVAYGDIPPHATWHIAYECPWCDAVISRADMQRWFAEAKFPAPQITTSRALLRIGEEVVEADGSRCDCGLPYVRELGRGAEWCHLAGPISIVEILRN